MAHLKFGGHNMFSSSLLLLSLLIPASLAQIVNAPPATFTETFTPVPSESVVLTETKRTTASPEGKNHPHPGSSTILVSNPQTTVSFPLGDTYLATRGSIIGVFVGSIIGVDATATTYQLNCNPNVFGCETTEAPLTITQGPSTVRFIYLIQEFSYTESYTQNCTSLASSPLSCLVVDSTTQTLPTRATAGNGGKGALTASHTTTNTLIYSGPKSTISDNEGRFFVNGGTVPYVAVPITAGIEKIAAFEASKTSSVASSSPTSAPGTSTGAAGTGTGNSGAGSLKGGIWVVVVTTIAVLCSIS